MNKTYYIFVTNHHNTCFSVMLLYFSAKTLHFCSKSLTYFSNSTLEGLSMCIPMTVLTMDSIRALQYLPEVQNKFALPFLFIINCKVKKK